MSKKILVFLMFSWMSFFTVISQNNTIPNKPNEIRLLDESYKENYQTNDYDYIEGVSLITRFKIWLFEKLRNLFKIDNNAARHTFNNLEFILYFIVIALAVYLLVKMLLGKEARWLFKRNSTKSVDLDYDIEENIQAVNFNKLIEQAVINKDYRLAIKYHYFYLLRKLDDANIIKYDPQKTTYDYQLDLEGTQYNSIFSKAAYYYTYIWYGEFSIDTNEYETTSNTFTQLLKSIKDE